MGKALLQLLSNVALHGENFMH